MNPGEQNEFDAELDAILNPVEEASPAQPTPVQGKEQTTAAASSILRAGGREFKDASELAKAYEALTKDYTKKGQSLKEGEKWINWGKAISKHESLRTKLESEIEAFNRQAATQPGGNQPAISQELQERMDRYDAFMAKQELSAEVSRLKAQYKPDEDTMKLVFEKAEQLLTRGTDLPLDDIYRIVAYERNTLKAKEEGAAGAAERLKRSRAGNVGSSSPAGVAPAAKAVNEMTGEEFDRELENELKKYGQTG